LEFSFKSFPQTSKIPASLMVCSNFF
jgi:hypothetical protein